MPRTIGYARVSSEEQARGSSLQDQQDAITAYAQARGLKVARFYVESESAVHEKIERREQMLALMRDVRAGDLVLCDKLDRWSRDPEFTYGSVRKILAAGASFYAVSDRVDPSTSEGDTSLGFRVLFAREEHKRIKERMVGTRKILRDKGYYVEGLPPFGYRRAHPRGYKGVEKNVLVVEPSEAELVRRAFRLCAAGRSLSRMASDLGLTKDRLCSILSTRVYLGEVKSTSGEWTAARHEAVVDADLFDRATSALHARRHGGARPRGAPSRTDEWVLRDVAVCARCGARMSSAWAKSRDYYRCSRRCTPRYVRVDVVDAAFAPLVLARLVELRDELAHTPPDGVAAIVDYDDRRAKIARRRERFLEAYADETMTRDELRAAMARLDADRLRVDAEEGARRRPSALAAPAARREALREVATLAAAWQGADGRARRALASLLCTAVRIEAGAPPMPAWKDAASLLDE